MQPVARTSESIENTEFEKLREIFPQFVKEGEVDFDALKNFFDVQGLIVGEEKYGLNWNGKRRAMELIRATAKGTLVPEEKESVDWDKTENVFIEGDNLEVLKLLQKKYRGEIKMIYIDPPYNTGKDFVYKDNFTQNVADYYEQTGQTDGGVRMQANTEKNGRYHSDWLTMMYPRLFLAKNLLQDDGVIFVSIDDHELHNLRLIMDEIFGEENFHGQITWKNRTKPKNIGGAKFSLQQNIEYIVVYGKVPKDEFKFKLPETLEKSYEHKDVGGEYRLEEIQQRKNLGSMRRDLMVYELLKITPKKDYRWQLSAEKRDELLSKEKLISLNNRIYQKIHKKEEEGFSCEPFWSHRVDTGTAESAKEELEFLMAADDIFDTVKPLDLIKQILCFMPEDSLVLDFFAGSGTTAHAVMDRNAEDGGNRRWICIQLPEVTDEKSEAYKAGYKNIAEISRERIRRAGAKIAKGDVGFKSFTLQKSNYREWSVLTEEDDEQKLLNQSKLFLEYPLVDNFDEKAVVYELLLKEGFSLNATVENRVEALPHTDNDETQWFGHIAWRVTEGNKKMFITFDKKIAPEQIEAFAQKPEDIVVCFDSALDDTAKLNISRNVNLKVI